MRSPRASLCALFLLALPCPSRADVMVVDAAGAGTHRDIQAAVDAALDGDTILVRRPPVFSRRFRGFVVDGKSLVIQGDATEPVRVGPVVVRNLSPGQQVELSHLRVNPAGYPLPPNPSAVGLELEDNEGAVWVHGCDVSGGSPSYGAGVVAMRVRACDETILTRSQVTGGFGGEGLDGGDGIVARGSALWVYGSEVAGGHGGYGVYGWGPGGRGGDGCRLRGSSLYAAASVVRGGDGGDTFDSDSEGGDGLVVPGDSTAVAFDTELLGGEPGILSDGTYGESVIGAVIQLPGSAPSFESPRTAEQGTTVSLRFVGTPGDAVVLLVSGRVVAHPLGSGYLHVGGPLRRILVGTLPASGEMSYPFVVPDAAPGGARRLVLQSVFVRPGTGALASGPELLISLDPLFVPRCGGRIHVDGGAPPGGDGSSWASAYRDLHVALSAVPECPDEATEVWVAEGTYRPAEPGGSPERNFYVYSDTHLYGGFEGTETSLDERDPDAHPVILSGDLNGDDTPGFGNRTDNSAHVLQSGVNQFHIRNVRLDGLVVRGGNALAHGSDQVAFRGGGLYARGDIEIVRCTFTDNHADVLGGGLYWLGSVLSISHCRFVGNHTDGRGAGIYAETGGPGPLRVSNTLIAGNVSTGNGGGGLSMRSWGAGSSREIRNCLVYANRGGFTSGGIADGDTFDDPLVIANTVCWGNVASSGSGEDAQVWTLTDDARVDYSCVQGLDALPGSGSIGDDPRFVDPVGPDGIPGTFDDDLHLDAGSPCVDAGSNPEAASDFADLDRDGDVDEPAPLDLGGAPRFVDDPGAPDTGEGTPPLVDIGPFERVP